MSLGPRLNNTDTSHPEHPVSIVASLPYCICHQPKPANSQRNADITNQRTCNTPKQLPKVCDTPKMFQMPYYQSLSSATDSGCGCCNCNTHTSKAPVDINKTSESAKCRPADSPSRALGHTFNAHTTTFQTNLAQGTALSIQHM